MVSVVPLSLSLSRIISFHSIFIDVRFVDRDTCTKARDRHRWNSMFVVVFIGIVTSSCTRTRPNEMNNRWRKKEKEKSRNISSNTLKPHKRPRSSTKYTSAFYLRSRIKAAIFDSEVMKICKKKLQKYNSSK